MKRTGGRVWRGGRHSICLLFCCLFTSEIFADLGPQNILLLVNSNSATSQYIARMYRTYYPSIQDHQVLELGGLPDCSGPVSTAADEIISRDVYETCIAEPLRQHLLNYGLVSQIMVIVTTAGLPYRIEDTVYPNVVYAAGSNYNDVVVHLAEINAASVESELTCLWVSNYGPSPAGLSNRLVNPYQGYRNSSITLFARSSPGSETYTWNYPVTPPQTVPPKMEGQMPMQWPPLYGTINRQFGPGDMYLSCRLDGPKTAGQSAVFAVRRMLERSKRASSPQSGINPASGVIVVDDCPALTLDINRVYNLSGTMEYYTFNPTTKQPPDAKTVLTLDDFTKTFDVLSSDVLVSDTGLSVGWFEAANGLNVLLDRRNGTRTCQADLEPGRNLIYLCGYGRNGDEGSWSNYLSKGFNGGPLFTVADGAIFTSLESYNAATLFSNIETSPMAQGKLVDFISIGGSAAMGYAFEPMTSAAVNNVFVTYNLFADSDADGKCDLTFVEAAFTGVPFLSWAHVVMGDPLMRFSYGPGSSQAWTQYNGDVNGDNRVNIIDIAKVQTANGGALYSTDLFVRSKYNDLCDFNADGRVNIIDISIVKNLNGSIK